jgi:hypothetical protein
MSAVAGLFFLELGLGAAIQGCIENGPLCSDDPLGIVSAGYQKGPIVLQYDHYSSIDSRDYGLDVLSIRYRVEF